MERSFGSLRFPVPKKELRKETFIEHMVTTSTPIQKTLGGLVVRAGGAHYTVMELFGHQQFYPRGKNFL